MDKFLYLLSAFGIKAAPDDVEAIFDMATIEENALPVLEGEAAQLREQLADLDANIAAMKAEAGRCRTRIGSLKSGSHSSGLPIESNEHRSRSNATLYYLRQRATVEPVHRAEIAQYVYGDRDKGSLSRLSLVLCVLKRKGMVRNGPRGYWFPL
jgi:hypothetical protein